jgi:membrane protease YdiL (CAAX protease family)
MSDAVTVPPLNGRIEQAQQPQPSKAQYLYTILLVALLLVMSLTGASRQGEMAKKIGHAGFYLSTIGYEIVLFFLALLGMRLARMNLREVIGGKWKSIEDVLIDFVIAIGFWVASGLVLFAVGWLLGLANPKNVEATKRMLDWIAPTTGPELALGILLSCTAGFVEEVIFRGYLQRQFAKLSGNLWIGLVISALIFGASHGYEGTLRMIQIAVYGMMFGLLVVLRKNLRPGMIAHAMQDSFALTAAFVLVKYKLLH